MKIFFMLVSLLLFILVINRIEGDAPNPCLAMAGLRYRPCKGNEARKRKPRKPTQVNRKSLIL